MSEVWGLSFDYYSSSLFENLTALKEEIKAVIYPGEDFETPTLRTLTWEELEQASMEDLLFYNP